MLAPEEFASRCNELLERVHSRGVGALTPGERAVYDANRFLSAYESGSLSGLLYNIAPAEGPASWSELTGISESLRMLGCVAAADELASLGLTLATAKHAPASTWADFCAAVGDERLSRADHALGQQVPKIWAQLETFVSTLPILGAKGNSVA
jgi:hypothetical protein